MKLDEIRNTLENYYCNLGYIYQPSAPLMHDFFPMSFNMSAGFVQLEPYIHNKKRIDKMDIVTTQKCIRHFDLKKAGNNASHATFFEMFGALTLGEQDKSFLITNFHKLLLSLEIDVKRLAVSVFGGDTIYDRFFPSDKISKKTWLELGLQAEQIFVGDHTNTFWFQGGSDLDDKTKGSPFDTRLCGYQTEVFYDLTKISCNNNCGPFCNCGRWLEIGNNLDIRFEYSPITKQFHDLDLASTETVTGIERLLVATNKLTSIWDIKEFRQFYQICSMLGIKDVCAQRELLDRLRALLFIASENLPEPGKNGRNKIVRKMMRDVLSNLYLIRTNNEYIDKSITLLTKEIIYLYSKKYDEIIYGSGNLKKSLLQHNKVFQKSMKHAISSIENRIAKGIIKRVRDSELSEFKQKLGIRPELVQKYFRNVIDK